MSAERQRHGHTEPLSWSPRVWTAHTRQLSVFLTELFDPSLLQNAFTRQLSLISNLSWRQKLKSHHVCKETIRCLLRYLLAFLQTNVPYWHLSVCSRYMFLTWLSSLEMEVTAVGSETPIFWQDLSTISSLVCDDQNRYLRPQRDLFRTLRVSCA